jgi:ankyrin repeat protein
MMRRLLRNGALPTARDSAQQTPLHNAARLGDMGSLVLILGEPWLGYFLTPDEVNAADANGRTPLHFAALFGDARFCAVLLAAGASLTIVQTTDRRRVSVCGTSSPQVFKSSMRSIAPTSMQSVYDVIESAHLLLARSCK